MDNLSQKIKAEILSSKKYKNIYEPTLTRIIAALAKKYPEKTLLKEVKNYLHQNFGAYIQKQNYKKILTDINFQASLTSQSNGDINRYLIDILKMHSSTAERLGFIEEFYRKIFIHIGNPELIVEPACGFNPLTYPFMHTNASYIGFDLDYSMMEFVNNCAKSFGFANKVSVKTGDILVDDFINCDALFLFKTLPVLEMQEKGSGLRIIRDYPAKYIVVSFPTKSLGGKKKNMEAFYSEYFEKILLELNLQAHKLIFENEVVWVVEK